MKKMNKILVIALAVCVLAMTAMGATLAWLTSQDVVTNTFTVGSNVTIELYETDNTDPTKTTKANTYVAIPGATYAKNPTVTVKKGSEDCFVFVKIVAAEDIIYTIADGWTALAGQAGVWYREYTKDTAKDVNYGVLDDDQVTVATDCPVDTLKDPQLMTITGYAIQADHLTGGSTAANAWSLLNPSSGS